jgi:transposase
MSHKRLNDAEKAELKQMVINGVAPDDISKHFGVAISSVHNFKKQLRDQGVNFPNVKGKRPTGVVAPSGSVKAQSSVAVPSARATTSTNTNVIVNGVSYEVSAQAKKVIISKGEIRVDF